MQYILNRANTPNSVPPKVHLGAAEEDGGETETGASIATAQASSEPTAVRIDGSGAGSKDKR